MAAPIVIEPGPFMRSSRWWPKRKINISPLSWRKRKCEHLQSGLFQSLFCRRTCTHLAHYPYGRRRGTGHFKHGNAVADRRAYQRRLFASQGALSPWLSSSLTKSKPIRSILSPWSKSCWNSILSLKRSCKSSSALRFYWTGQTGRLCRGLNDGCKGRATRNIGSIRSRAAHY